MSKTKKNWRVRISNYCVYADNGCGDMIPVKINEDEWVVGCDGSSVVSTSDKACANVLDADDAFALAAKCNAANSGCQATPEKIGWFEICFENFKLILNMWKFF